MPGIMTSVTTIGRRSAATASPRAVGGPHDVEVGRQRLGDVTRHLGVVFHDQRDRAPAAGDRALRRRGRGVVARGRRRKEGLHVGAGRQLRRRRRAFRRRAHGQLHGEGGPTRLGRPHAHRPPEQAHELPHDGEPEPRPAMATVRAHLALAEPVEHELALLGGSQDRCPHRQDRLPQSRSTSTRPPSGTNRTHSRAG
jgi:hypothetical protein